MTVKGIQTSGPHEAGWNPPSPSPPVSSIHSQPFPHSQSQHIWKCPQFNLLQLTFWWMVCFLVTALLPYNSYNPKFTVLKCTIQLFLIYSQSYTTITTNFKTFSSLQKDPHTHQQSPPTTPTPGQLLIYFLTPWIWLFWTFHKHKLIP